MGRFFKYVEFDGKTVADNSEFKGWFMVERLGKG
jgi:hypothetical protein